MKPLLPVLLLAAVLPFSAPAAAPMPRTAQGVIELPGGNHGIGFDDIGYLAALHRVIVPAGATGNVVLIDPLAHALTIIPGVSAAPAGHATRREGTSSAVYAEGYLFASDHDPAAVVTIDPRSRKIVARTPLQGEPDYVRYVARTREIWVTEPDRQQIQVFRFSASPKPVLTPETTIAIQGGPESLETDDPRNRAYANLWKGKTVALELTTHRVLAEWPNTCQGSRGLALDNAHDHVFVACSEGKVVTLAPGDHGKILAAVSAGAGIDIIRYSPKLHHLYVPGARSATLTIFDAAPSGKLQPLSVYRTAEHAHCVTDDDDGHVFVCDPRAGAILTIDDR